MSKFMEYNERSIKGNFIAVDTFIKKQNRCQISNLTLHLKEIWKKEQSKPKSNGKKEIISIRKINKIENRRIIEKINKLKVDSPKRLVKVINN